MKKIILVFTVMSFLLPLALYADFQYLSENEYKKLNSTERQIYWENLENELLNYQQRRADAIARKQSYEQEIDQLRTSLQQTEAEYNEVYDRIVAYLNVPESDLQKMRDQLAYYNNTLDTWARLSDSEIINIRKDFNSLKSDYANAKKTNAGKHPDFRASIVEIDNKISNLEATLERLRPSYYEDEYTVVRGDYLSKIAGYSFIYNDSSKWGIIFRANRDQIRDPNLIYPDQVLKIPRGLPDTWKVHRGEFLWRIASYPEVYGQGSKWPLIYRANKDQIKNPDLIYPNQIFRIPRD